MAQSHGTLRFAGGRRLTRSALFRAFLALAATSVATGALAMPDAATIAADMQRLNDRPLAGAPKGPQWATGPGFLVMGANPRGSATPDYWKPAEARFKSDAGWRAFIPWLVVFSGEGNAATHAMVEMRNLTAWLQSKKTGEWRRLGVAREIHGENYPTHVMGSDTSPASLEKNDRGYTLLKPKPGTAFHGWWNYGKMRIDPEDIANVFVTVEGRLVPGQGWLWKPEDDRDRAEFLLQVGADWWPDVDTRLEAFAPERYNPGSGGSRFKLLTNEWQWVSFTTVPLDQIASSLPPAAPAASGK